MVSTLMGSGVQMVVAEGYYYYSKDNAYNLVVYYKGR